ncbi:tetratricopeptide repeat protein [Frigidibacter sp. MR17.24]|uniref:tetratricopeptide repeat protein n=1 Tax=Frigidibacter sp. MR17.24 TaxID=3127345 RepID=UPI003012C1A3
MPATFRPVLTVPLLVATLLVSGCKTDEERAAGFLQSANELLAAGDTDRAMIELRNVFRYDGTNREARETYARLLTERGEIADAYSQYLRLIEQNPNDLDLRLRVAEMALKSGNWDEFQRHTAAAEGIEPRNPAVRALVLARDYREAVQRRDAAKRSSIADSARVMLASFPDLQVARRIVIDETLAGPRPLDALPEVEEALTREPAAYELNLLKFRLQVQAGDLEASGAQIRAMYERWPENAQVRGLMVAWLRETGDTAGAEAFLRRIAGPDDGAVDGHLMLVQFLRQTGGDAAALAELDRLIAANGATEAGRTYVSTRAGMVFDQGDRDGAIAQLQSTLEGAEPSQVTDRTRVMLARMLLATGDRVGARAQVEQVLGHDSGQIDALKLRGRMLIDEDKPGDAIISLRQAQGQAAGDPEIPTLLAEAHFRAGDAELGGQMLAQAVSASGNAAAESLRYASYLLQDGRTNAASGVLAQARRVTPDDVRLIGLQANIALQASDWTTAAQLLEQLRRIDTPQAQDTARRLQAALLTGQNRFDESIDFLRGLVTQNDNSAQSVAQVLQAQIQAGRTDEARSYLDGLLADKPDDRDLRLLSGTLDALRGENEAAERALRKLNDETPGNEQVIRILFGVLQSQGRADEAAEVLAAGLAANPTSRRLRWIQAGEFERTGKIEEAIGLYEQLYAENSDDVVIANNLASMITGYRDDPESLERGYTIARRLRTLNHPAYQDTYGWIIYRRGDVRGALTYLEAAARGRSNDPLIQYHLAVVYDALKRPADAAPHLRRALEIAGDSALPQMEAAREMLARIESGTPPAGAPDAAPAGAPDGAPAAAPTDPARPGTEATDG